MQVDFYDLGLIVLEFGGRVWDLGVELTGKKPYPNPKHLLA
jgi:hypothetical protein